jgi:hypothetical protein
MYVVRSSYSFIKIQMMQQSFDWVNHTIEFISVKIHLFDQIYFKLKTSGLELYGFPPEKRHTFQVQSCIKLPAGMKWPTTSKTDTRKVWP